MSAAITTAPKIWPLSDDSKGTPLYAGDRVRLLGYWPGRIKQSDAGSVVTIVRLNKARNLVIGFGDGRECALPSLGMIVKVA